MDMKGDRNPLINSGGGIQRWDWLVWGALSQEILRYGETLICNFILLILIDRIEIVTKLRVLKAPVFNRTDILNLAI